MTFEITINLKVHFGIALFEMEYENALLLTMLPLLILPIIPKLLLALF